MFHVEHFLERMVNLELTIYHVDAFTDEPFGGNPAGVVLDSNNLTTEIMQKIANEVNLSETAFIQDMGADRYKIRYFTPLCEVDLCGHATIASFYSLAKQRYIRRIDEGTKTVRLITNKSQLYIDIEYKDGKPINIIMEQNTPQSFGVLESVEGIINSSNLKEEDLGFEGEDVKAEIISTGLKDIILPVKSKEALDNIEFHMCDLRQVSEDLDVTGVHAFYLPEKDSDEVYVRNFAPIVGIDEESATGTANGALIYYLKSHNLITRDQILVNQGETMGRPSKIYCSISKEDGQYKVRVGGSAHITMEGILKY